MGNKNSGRRPQPTTIKLLRGKIKPKQAAASREPIPPRPGDAFDRPPDELNGDAVAVAEWSRVVPMLRRIGLVSESERSALIAMCQQWSRYLDAQRSVRDDGAIVITAKGRPIVNPAIAIGDKALQHCLKLWVELGLTPSGRSRMSALPDVAPATPSKWAGVL